jgi:hypothetical protein
MTERRKEIRYGVPEIYQKYITFKIKKDPNEFLSVKLLDFSLKGIKMKIPFVLAVDSTIECLISIPKSLTKEILFSVKINYCIQDESDGEYLIGAEIIQTSNTIWLNLFSKVHDFINQRIGNIF